MQHTQDAVAGGLGLFGGDGDFFPQHPIEQGRLAGVGCAENRNVTGSKIGILFRDICHEYCVIMLGLVYKVFFLIC